MVLLCVHNGKVFRSKLFDEVEPILFHSIMTMDSTGIYLLAHTFKVENRKEAYAHIVSCGRRGANNTRICQLLLLMRLLLRHDQSDAVKVRVYPCQLALRQDGSTGKSLQ